MTPLAHTAGSAGHGPILVTGAAGFIGFHLCQALLDAGTQVVGIDNLNSYYSVALKQARLGLLDGRDGFTFLRGDIADAEFVEHVFTEYAPSVVVHLAAQAGVRYSIENPESYVESNLIGFFRILEACRHHPVRHLLYASSSSVYGGLEKAPFEETDPVDKPVSLYAATKKADELMAFCYSHLYSIPATGLRFFTVYGPYGRPDMAYFGFSDAFVSGQPIRVFNNGDLANDLLRDFTYVDDVVSAVVELIDLPPQAPDPHEIFNIGNNTPEPLMSFISALEESFSQALGRAVVFEKIFEPLKPGDVRATHASTDRLHQRTGFRPHTPLRVGLQRFVDWYVEYHHLAVTSH